MDETKKLHVVLFPWLAFGHLIPFFELAKQIARKGHKVSYVSTSKNIDRLPKLSQKLTYSINFVNLSLPLTSGLPEYAEATKDVPLDKVEYLKKAFDGLEPELTRFLEDSAPDWIIYDFTPHWLPVITGRLGISRAFFCTFNAWSSVFFGPVIDKIDGNNNLQRIKPEDFTVPPKWIPFPSNIAYRLYEIKRFLGHGEENVSGVSDWHRLRTSLSGCDVFLIRSCNELEREWLDLLPELHQKPVVPVGLLPPSVQDTEGDKDDTWGFINNWLAMQREKSVVYVALGTEATPSQDELTELAHGLELSGLPFFWVLRKQHDFLSLKLPEGFEERTKNQGIVWMSWAPQLRILENDSVGVFLTHCGWGSIIEGLQFGKPLVMLPFLGDQALNARGLEEKRLGLEIPRNENDGSLTQNSVAESLKLVMNDDKGKIYWEKANEMRKIFGNRDLKNKYIDYLIEYLHKIRNDE